MTDRNQLRQLLSAGQDGELSASDQEKISQLLEQDLALVQDYVDFVANESLIEQSCGLSFRDDNDNAPHLPIAAAERAGDSNFGVAEVSGGSTWFHRLISHPVWALAAVLLVAVTIGLGWLTKSPTSTVIVASDAQLADGQELRAGRSLGDRWINLQRGSIRIAFQDGAMASIESPARFRVLDGNSAELAHGAVTCHVPDSAHGFVVASHSNRIVDLGTGFRAVAATDGSLSVHVTQGVVRIDPSTGESLRLPAGQLAEVTSDGQATIVSESLQQPIVAGQFRFREEHPKTLGYDDFVHDDVAYVFLESHAVRTPHDLRLDLAEAGSHTSFLGSPRIIPEGTMVDCYLIHCAPQRKRHEVKGSVTFPGEILGLLTNDDRLNATNELLGAQWTLACQHPERGIESLPDVNSDRLKISRDRRTLSGYFRTMSIDQVRVLVARRP